jgi:hypothetical protein
MGELCAVASYYSAQSSDPDALFDVAGALLRRWGYTVQRPPRPGVLAAFLMALKEERARETAPALNDLLEQRSHPTDPAAAVWCGPPRK